jgi:hypothetical protein
MMKNGFNQYLGVFRIHLWLVIFYWFPRRIMARYVLAYKEAVYTTLCSGRVPQLFE